MTHTHTSGHKAMLGSVIPLDVCLRFGTSVTETMGPHDKLHHQDRKMLVTLNAPQNPPPNPGRLGAQRVNDAVW